MLFFNRQNEIRGAVQVYNVLAFSLAAYSLVTNPQARVFELGFDMVISAITYLSLQENASVLSDLSASALNLIGFGAIYANLTSGCTSLSMAFGIIIGLGHLLNFATSMGTLSDEESKSSPKNS